MIKNVEKMLQKEKQAAKATRKGGAKLVSFDLNEGMVGAVSLKASASKAAAGEPGSDAAAGELDEDIKLITRKAPAVRADNINEVFTENITAITAAVNTFQQMEEETVQNDPALLYQKAKDDYDHEIEKLQSRVAK